MRAPRLIAALSAAAVALTGLLAAPAAQAAPATSVYVAMGDSFSSGEGACRPVAETQCRYSLATDTAVNQCHRSANAYPVRVAATLPHSWKLVFVACSGAETANVLSSGQFDEQAQLAALKAATTPTRVVKLVTMTLGGNDAGFAAAVGTCVFARYFLNSSCHGKVTWSLPIATVTARLAKVYAAVHAVAPHARLVVLGYPRVFAAKPKPPTQVVCNVGADAPAFSRAEDKLNAGIAAAVAKANTAAHQKFATFVDNGAIFTGHELCFAPAYSAYLNLASLGADDGAPVASFHPNRSGQSVMAKKLETVLKG